ncbi:MAG: ATP-dependent protease LonB [Clostridia bacterium]|nr:ATP-dependent protease LonB [Clostridia bacterium]
MFLTIILFLIQLAVTVTVGVYFFTQLRKEKSTQPGMKRESAKEMENLRRMRSVSLSKPLSEHIRPRNFEDIVGQQEGIRSLKAILCGANPQHVIIYGPPGIGKTCAARAVLEYAKHSEGTPFKADAPFIEIDATCVRFDERAIADPLFGSVHDPIYQGAGALGVQGVPQPKPGAVTKAHGGVLFLDEIGELHPIQMNKLLKVLEDRRVQFDSAYYDPDDNSVPRYIHDIFRNGMPADFRLIGATTRSPEELPPALRSRCMEVFFRPLESDEIASIAQRAAGRAGYNMEKETAAFCSRYAACGRDAINMVQMAAGLAQMDKRDGIDLRDMEWVVQSGHYPAKPEQIAPQENRVGAVHGLAVYGSHQGAVMEIEASVVPGMGRVLVTGIVDEEELGSAQHVMRRRSTARVSADNVTTVLKMLGYLQNDKDVHVNFPGGAPVDGPSAGAAMAVAAISALTGRPVDGGCAITGEISVQGRIKPVGGIPEKVEAAKRAGLVRVYIPRENMMERFEECNIEVMMLDEIHQAVEKLLLPSVVSEKEEDAQTMPILPLIASPSAR